MRFRKLYTLSGYANKLEAKEETQDRKSSKEAVTLIQERMMVMGKAKKAMASDNGNITIIITKTISSLHHYSTCQKQCVEENNFSKYLQTYKRVITLKSTCDLVI